MLCHALKLLTNIQKVREFTFHARIAMNRKEMRPKWRHAGHHGMIMLRCGGRWRYAASRACRGCRRSGGKTCRCQRRHAHIITSYTTNTTDTNTITTTVWNSHSVHQNRGSCSSRWGYLQAQQAASIHTILWELWWLNQACATVCLYSDWWESRAFLGVLHLNPIGHVRWLI